MALNSQKSTIFNREFAMPNAKTYDIPCIKKLIHKYLKSDLISIDPFANSSKIAKITNDLDPQYSTTYNMDAKEFLKSFEKQSVDFILYDPPYSSRQVSEVYKKFDLTVNMETTQSAFWIILKTQIARIITPNGIVISFGWNTNGIGLNLGFEIIEILLVAHGGHHHDTLCVVERKIQTTLL